MAAKSPGLKPSNKAMVLAATLAYKTWTIVAGGDIMLNAIKPSPRVFASICDIVSRADLAMANLEIPLTNSRIATMRKSASEIAAKTQFILKAEPAHAIEIKKAGFDVLAMANNHAMDYGWTGAKQMREAISNAGMQCTGVGQIATESRVPVIFGTRQGPKVAILAFHAFQTERALWKCTYATDRTPGVATLLPSVWNLKSQTQVLQKLVKNAKQNADLVVIWLHWGTERKTLPDPYQVTLARALIDAGADCILGAHPHVLQGAELYKNRPVFYSLGNLISPLPSRTGLVSLEYSEKQFSLARFLPCEIKGGTVFPVGSKFSGARINDFKNLCAQIQKKYRNPKSRIVPLSILSVSNHKI